jgi:hypothetical protein
MKALIFAAALLTAGTAFAQADMSAQPAGDQSVAPGNSAPERDARGIPVVSAEAMAPAGTNQPVVVQPGQQVIPNPNQAQAFMPQPAAGEMPPCTREVTDHCTQTYEGTRGRRRR